MKRRTVSRLPGDRDRQKIEGRHSEIGSLILNLYRARLAASAGLSVRAPVDFTSLSQAQKAELAAPAGESEVDFGRLRTAPPSEESLRAVTEKHRRYIPGYKERLRSLILLARESGIEPIFATQPAVYGPAVFTGLLRRSG